MTPFHAPAKSLKAYYPALTGLRAVAAWLVFFHHFNPFPVNSVGWRFVQQWYVGVAIFFVLSGLLICVRYVGQTKLTKTWGLRYLRNRVARIYPMYLLTTCATFAIVQLRPAYDLTTLWNGYIPSDKWLIIGLNVTFLRGFFDQFKFTGVAQGWTMTVEECFYFLAPLLLLGLRSRPWRLLGYAAGLVSFGVALVQLAPHFYGFFNSFTFLFSVTFFGRCVEFLAGIGLGLLLLSKFKPDGHFYTWMGLAWIVGVIAAMSWVDNPAAAEATTIPLRMFLIGLTQTV